MSWKKNCQAIVKKVNARMQLLYKYKEIGSTNEELVMLWILYCRSILEKSSVVWSTSLTNENIYELERTQKSFCKMVLEEKYVNYETALLKLNMKTLEERRNELNLKFAKNAIKNQTLRNLFTRNENQCYNTRSKGMYSVFHANTERKQKLSVIQMQHQLNNNSRNKLTFK